MLLQNTLNSQSNLFDDATEAAAAASFLDLMGIANDNK
jgi:hypothetical protein